MNQSKIFTFYRGRAFKPKPFPTAFCAFFFILFVFLGRWQWHRYKYKQDIQQRYQAALQMPATPIDKLGSPKNKNFYPVSLKGHYLNGQTMYLQNRFRHGKPGYEVLTPFSIAAGPTDNQHSKNLSGNHHQSQTILVNRGWSAAGQGNSLPNVQNVNSSLSLEGYIGLEDPHTFILGDNIMSKTARPIVMQKIDLNALTQMTQLHFAPFVVRLKSKQPGALATDWKPLSVLPERHLGYTVQWFAMAFVLAIAYLIWSSPKTSNRRKNDEL